MMKKNVIYEKPTVKQVIFQIRFPNLFFIESKIGDFQICIMEKFPKPSLLMQQQFFVSIGNPGEGDSNLPAMPQSPSVTNPINKIWKFESPNGVSLEVASDSLTLVSLKHKTYQSSSIEEENFRSIIQFVVQSFFDKIAPIPMISRIGLRYVDVAPEFFSTTDDFKKYFNSRFPLQDFTIEDTSEMTFRAVVKREKAKLTYAEKFTKKAQDKFSYIIDFDAFMENISASGYLINADVLHETLVDEYRKVITEEMEKYMDPLKPKKKSTTKKATTIKK